MAVSEKDILSKGKAFGKERTEILISGFGGQGVIKLGQTIGVAAVSAGLRVTMVKSHGTETRGGYVRSQLVLSPTFVDSPIVENADYFVAFSAPAYSKFYDLAPGIIFYDPATVTKIKEEDAHRHVEVPATAMAQEKFEKTLFANSIMLGAVIKVSQILRPELVQETMKQLIPKFQKENQAAFELGYNLVNPKSP